MFAKLIVVYFVFMTACYCYDPFSSSEEHDWLPPFAKNLDNEAKEALKKILHDDSLTVQEVINKMKEWAAKDAPELKKLLKDFDQKLADILMNMLSESRKLSNKAQLAVEEIIAVESNFDLTAKEMRKTVKAVFDSLDKETLKEVKEFLKKFESMIPSRL